MEHFFAPKANHNNQDCGLDMEDTCGIIAVIGHKDADSAPSVKTEAVDYLLEGLAILQNRGYDSAGICTLDTQNDMVISKFSSNEAGDALRRLEGHKRHHNGHSIGIGHTRWATHGGKTDNNAHPHTDMKGRIALVHNGVIENSNELRRELQAKGIKFSSETDTEVIAQLIGSFMDEGLACVDALKKAQDKLEGTWGLVVVDKSLPDQLIAARNGSPLVIGLGDGQTFIASEATAFSKYTGKLICMENNEVAIIRADSKHTLDLSRIEKRDLDVVQLTPHPYPHWTIKEILEQPEAVARAISYGGRIRDGFAVKLGGLEMNKHLLLRVQHLVIAACGTSYHAGMYGAKMMRNLKCFETVQVFDAADITQEDFPPNSGLLVISQSGETKDVIRALTLGEELGIPYFSVVNAVGSEITRITRCGVYTNAGREHAVASTKAFTSQVTVLSLIAVWFAQHRNEAQQQGTQVPTTPQANTFVSPNTEQRGNNGFRISHIIERLHRLPVSMGMCINSVRAKCQEIAKQIYKQNNMFVLGKGYGESIAREGALKIKEITYMHAEGYGSGALKHGPFALIEQGTPIFIVLLDDVHAPKNRTCAEEVKGRGANVIAITDKPSLAADVCHHVIRIPSNGVFTALIATIPFQIIAYEIALLREYNPDKPRNLAKTVTVD